MLLLLCAKFPQFASVTTPVCSEKLTSVIYWRALWSSHSLFSDLLGQKPDSVLAEEYHEFVRQLGEGCFSGICSHLNFFSFQVTNSNCCCKLLWFIQYECLTVLSPFSTYCVECFTCFGSTVLTGEVFIGVSNFVFFVGDIMTSKNSSPMFAKFAFYQRSLKKDCRVCHSSLEAWMLWVLENSEISYPEEGPECDIFRCFLEQHECFPLVYRGYLRGYRRESLPLVLQRSVCPHVHDSVGDGHWL